MKKWIPWLLGTLTLAVALHLLIMQAIPQIATRRMLANIFNQAKNWQSEKANILFHGKLRVAGKDKVPMDNPDTVTSFGYYDVSEQPLKMHYVIPRLGNYWSLSLFAWNTDNFFVVNDRQITGNELDLVLVKDADQYQPEPGEQVVVSPSAKGVILVRMIVKDRHDQQELDTLSAVQQLAFVKPLK